MPYMEKSLGGLSMGQRKEERMSGKTGSRIPWVLRFGRYIIIYHECTIVIFQGKRGYLVCDVFVFVVQLFPWGVGTRYLFSS